MQAIICEICGSNELIKEDGMFRCTDCNTLYTLDEARKLFVDGPIQVEGVATTQNLIERAKEFIAAGNSDKAHEYCNRALDADPANAEARELLAQAEQIIDKNNIRIYCAIRSETITVWVDGERVDIGPAMVACVKASVGKHEVKTRSGSYRIKIANCHDRYSVCVGKGIFAETKIIKESDDASFE